VAGRHVERIVGYAVPSRSSSREQAEWQSVVDAVVTLAVPCSSLDELEAKIAAQSQSLRDPPEDAVVLSTIHSAKALEWDTVFMVSVEDGVLPHINANDVEEERPVAYVGMTRARTAARVHECRSTLRRPIAAVALPIRDRWEREALLHLDGPKTGTSGRPPAPAHPR
jgi:superfamily I DNA/RNA helicase